MMLPKLFVVIYGLSFVVACGSNVSQSDFRCDMDGKSVYFSDTSGNGYYDISKIADSEKYVAVGRSRLSLNGTSVLPCGYTFYHDKRSWFLRIYIYDLDDSELHEAVRERVSNVKDLLGFSGSDFAYKFEGKHLVDARVSEAISHPENEDLVLRYVLKRVAQSDDPELEILVQYVGDDEWEIEVER